MTNEQSPPLNAFGPHLIRLEIDPTKDLIFAIETPGAAILVDAYAVGELSPIQPARAKLSIVLLFHSRLHDEPTRREIVLVPPGGWCAVEGVRPIGVVRMPDLANRVTPWSGPAVMIYELPPESIAGDAPGSALAAIQAVRKEES
jgi:hypothetical protein